MPERPSLRLRRANPEDAEAIADVYLTSRKECLPFAPLAHSDDGVRQWIRERLLPAGRVTVAEQEGRIVGMMALEVEAGESWIDQLYLHPDVLGQGIGSAMLQRAREELPAPIRLYTFQANTNARRFYERHGFVAVSFGDGSGNEENCPDVLYRWG